MKAAFIPQVNDELDTQNFEKFEEVTYWYDENIGGTDDMYAPDKENNVYSSLIPSGTDWQASSKVVKVRSMEKGMA